MLPFALEKFSWKNNLRDWLRVDTAAKDAYELPYFNFDDADWNWDVGEEVPEDYEEEEEDWE